MKRILAIILALAWAVQAHAQVIGSQIVTANSGGGGCTAVAQSCASFQIGGGSPSLILQVSGTWTGTLTFETTSDGTNWVATALTDMSTGLTGTTTTASGQFALANTGVLQLRARATAAMTGTATVTATRGQASNVRGAAGAAPPDATYVTNTPSAGLTNEQALSALSTGIMRVATTTGAVTSLTDSAGIAANISDETGTGALVFGTGPTITLANATGLPVSTGISGLGTGVAGSLATNNGSAGAYVVFNGALGTPGSGTLTNATGYTVANLSGAGAGVLTFLGTPSSANFASAVTGETGTGAVVFGTQPTMSDIQTSGSTPSVGNVGANSCGTTSATIAGNDNSGEIVVGATSGTQCRITFVTAAPTRRHCTANDSTTTVAVRTTYVDTTHSDLLGSFTAGDSLTYICVAR